MDMEDQHFRCMTQIENIGSKDFLLELKIQNIYEIEEKVDSNDEAEVIISSKNPKILSRVGKLKEFFIKIKYSEQLRHKLKFFCVYQSTRAISRRH